MRKESVRRDKRKLVCIGGFGNVSVPRLGYPRATPRKQSQADISFQLPGAVKIIRQTLKALRVRRTDKNQLTHWSHILCILLHYTLALVITTSLSSLLNTNVKRCLKPYQIQTTLKFKLRKKELSF